MKGKLFKAFRQQSKIDPAIQKAEQVYEWASHLTGENIQHESPFYVTPDAQKVYWKINHANGGVIGIIGLQGIGKTRLLKSLANHVKGNKKETLFLSWGPNWFELLQEKDEEWRSAKTEAIDRLPFSTKYGFIEQMNFVFIDLPDYSKKNRGDMNKDLLAIQCLWKKVEEDQSGTAKKTTFILGIQKEMYGGHFFFGKMDTVELSALKPTELLDAYKIKWKSVEPFTEEALLLIAQLSRGIFRRFFRYVGKGIERAILSESPLPITIENVKGVITTEQLAKDMDLELTDLFKNNREQKMLAIKILACLRENKEINQKSLAELLDEEQMAVSRHLRTLETYGYIKRERGQQKEWKLMLAE